MNKKILCGLVAALLLGAGPATAADADLMEKARQIHQQIIAFDSHVDQLGILIDVSQLTSPALQQVLRLTKAPVVASHSGLKAIVDAPRNLSDEELDLIKQNGGVVQVVAFSNYLRKAAEGAGVKAGPATVAQFVDAIAYAIKRIGVDHVGIASDFNHGGGVEGWQNEGEAQNVTVELLRRGYSEREIAKLCGGNFLRVLGEAQQRAAALN